MASMTEEKLNVTPPRAKVLNVTPPRAKVTLSPRMGLDSAKFHDNLTLLAKKCLAGTMVLMLFGSFGIPFICQVRCVAFV